MCIFLLSFVIDAIIATYLGNLGLSCKSSKIGLLILNMILIVSNLSYKYDGRNLFMHFNAITASLYFKILNCMQANLAIYS